MDMLLFIPLFAALVLTFEGFFAALIGIVMLAILMMVIEKLFAPPADWLWIVRLLFLMFALCWVFGVFSGTIVIWGR